MSFLGKKWIIKDQKQATGLLHTLLNNRGVYDSEAQKEYLTENGTLHNPFLFNDMQIAVERINKAIKGNQKIIIFGDYDADGISGTAVLMHTLKTMGANASYQLPHRVNDGYGLSEKFVEVFKRENAKLIITVDCGISNQKEVAQINSEGIDVIITDHHTVPKISPDACAIIHPLMPNETYPFKGLTGSGVAFKLAQALFINNGFENDKYEELLDLASLGTVADMGPLTGENRLIVKKGLKLLADSKWKGLKMLKEISGISDEDKVNTNSIGFKICPRINAAGRIDTPNIALQLLLHEFEHEESINMAKKLEELNIKRREMTEQAVAEINELIGALNSQKIVIESSANWHVGIVGLVAGRVSEAYGLPAIVLQDFGDYLVGSCRSPKFFNVTEALTAHKELLEGYGGHAQAAGFSIKKENFNEFKTKMKDYANNKLKDEDIRSELNIDCELKENLINLDTVAMIEQMEPFGMENEQPLFILQGCEIENMKKVGSDKSHLKMRLRKGNKYIDSIGFSFGKAYEQLREYKKIDVAVHLERNNWNGKDYLQLRLADLRISKD